MMRRLKNIEGSLRFMSIIRNALKRRKRKTVLKKVRIQDLINISMVKVTKKILKVKKTRSTSMTMKEVKVSA